ncbi:MAG TPA: PASTA domain-containing protein [Thermoleophilaceae bacterium]
MTRKLGFFAALAAAVVVVALPPPVSAQSPFGATTVQSPPNPVPAGTVVTYTTTVTNTSGEPWPPAITPPPDVFVSMYLTVAGSDSRATPNSYQSVVGSPGGCSNDATMPPSVNCPIGSLAPAQAATYTSTVVAQVSMTNWVAVVGCASVDDCSSAADADVDTMVLQPCIVPNLLNRTLPSAKRRLAKHNCTLGKVKKKHAARRKRGRVVRQKPAPGTKLPNSGKVTLFLGKS